MVTSARRRGFSLLLVAAALLANPAKAASPVAAPTIALSEAARTCVLLDPLGDDELPEADDKCTVVASGLVKGTVPRLLYQVQTWTRAGQAEGGADRGGAGLALLQPVPGTSLLRRLAGGAGQSAIVAPPRLIRTVQGPIVVAKATASFSSRPNFDFAARRVGKTWVMLRDDWSRSIVIPEGVTQRHGNAMDWPSLQAYGAFWLPGDPECCPTGGSYIARLRLVGARLVLRSVRLSRDSLPWP